MIKIENILSKYQIKTDQNVFCTDILHLNNELNTFQGIWDLNIG